MVTDDRTAPRATSVDAESTPARQRGRDLLLVAGALLAGVLLVVLVDAVRGGEDGPAGGVAASDPTAEDTAGVAGAPSPRVTPGDGADTAVVAPGDATEPVEALASFLAAEVARDFEASYAFLATEDRSVHPSAARWRAAHRQLLPVRGFRIDAASLDVDGERATVEAAIAGDGVLDPVIGLVPAVARSTWVLQREGETWRVAFGQAAFEVVVPDDASAVEAARAWVETAAGCGETPDGVTRLFGSPRLVDAFCDAGGDVAVGAAGTLSPAGDTFGLVAAFGPEALSWTRVVPVDAPLAADLALVPLAGGWQVVGVLAR